MMLFMMAWYRKFGWAAITALVANLLMQVGCWRYCRGPC